MKIIKEILGVQLAPEHPYDVSAAALEHRKLLHKVHDGSVFGNTTFSFPVIFMMKTTSFYQYIVKT